MPQFIYKARDKSGTLRTGERFANSADTLNMELSREGIYPIEIVEATHHVSYLEKLQDLLENRALQLTELAIFARQMQILTRTGVPIVSALRQLATYTKSNRLNVALNGLAESLEKGKSLSSSMANYPGVFSPLIVNIVSLGENTGHLSEAFGHLYEYLEFESKNRKMIKSTFRYPMFVGISIIIAIIVLNIFVIPTFARFYTNIEISLPWETRFLIGMSTLFTKYGVYLAVGLIVFSYTIYRYIKSASGQYKLSYLMLRMPIFGKLYRQLILIRFAQSLSIILNSGVSISQGLTLVKNSLNNRYIEGQIVTAQEMIERGNSFTQAMTSIELFSSLEQQLIAVGEKNGELGQAMGYISTFQSSEIEFEIKRINDNIGPILLGIIAVMVLIIALGVYLPVWNMINLVH